MDDGLPPGQRERAHRAHCAREGRFALLPLLLDIERAVLGRDYGGTSWTRCEEADEIQARLRLSPGKRLLDLGAGSGWPALYLAQRSGCDVTLVDLPLDGLGAARARAARDRLSGACWLAAADAAALPFSDRAFDCIQHSDLLCCLSAKRETLAECRRVIREAGSMIFTVISIASGLAPGERERALAAGPPFKVEDRVFPELLATTGWRLAETVDLTPEYLRTMRRMIDEEERRGAELIALYGEADVIDTKARRRRSLACIEDRLLRRDLYVASASWKAAP